MKFKVGLLLLVIASLCLCACRLPFALDKRPIWSDEFDTPGAPDFTKWSYETGFVRNHEMQWYQASNAIVTNGCLVITGKKESRPNPWYGEAGHEEWQSERKMIEYTSACLHSKVQFQYGRMQIRAKIQAEEGLWPAIWFLGTEGYWPMCGEIDLLEYYDESIFANFCWSAGSRTAPLAQHWNTKKVSILEFLAKDPAWREAWHVWEIDWDKNRIELKVDGQVINTQLVKDAKNSDHSLPFTQPMYLLLNMAMGSSGGSLEKTKLPAKFIIDYVRLYR